MLLGTLEELAARLRAAADALDEVEAGWLRGAADLVERAGPERRAARAEAVWLEELASEAKARKASLLSAWVDAAESLRSAIHVHETERGPLVEALFPVWKGASLRRHVDQALAAQTELQRRLGSAYVVRRLAELTTQSAVGPALEALAAAGTSWAAERERPALSGDEADTVRTRLLGAAENGAQLLERVRSVVRAALVSRPELLEAVFPKRGRPAKPEAFENKALDAPAVETVAAEGVDSGAPGPADRPAAIEADPSSKPGSGRREKGAPVGTSIVGAASTRSSRRTPAAAPVTLPDSETARAPRRRDLAAEHAASRQGTSPRAARRGPGTTAAGPSDSGASRSRRRRTAAESAPPSASTPSRRRKDPPDETSVGSPPARTASTRRGKAAPPVILPDSEAVRAPRRRALAAAAPTLSGRGSSPRGPRRSAAEPKPAPGSVPRKRGGRGEPSVVPASPGSPRGRPAAPLVLPDSEAARAPRRHPLAAEPAAPTRSERGTSPRASRRSAAEPKPAPVARAAPPRPAPRGGRRPSRPSRRS